MKTKQPEVASRKVPTLTGAEECVCVCARMSRDNCAKQRKWKDSKHSNRKEMYLQVYFYFIYKRKVPKMANAVGVYSSFLKENNKYYGRKRKWKQSSKR